MGGGCSKVQGSVRKRYTIRQNGEKGKWMRVRCRGVGHDDRIMGRDKVTLQYRQLCLTTNSSNSLRFIILKFDMQTILNPNFHFYTSIRIRWHTIRMYPYFPLLYDLSYPSSEGDSQIIPKQSNK